MSMNKIRDLRREVARLRTIKSPREQAVLRKAADVSALAHAKVRKSHRIIRFIINIFL